MIRGVNLPWLSYGGDFGANAWHPGGGIARPEVRARLQEVLHTIAQGGAEIVRWFLFCDGRAGIRFDARGDVAGLDDHLLADVDAALEILGDAHLKALFVLFDFRWLQAATVVNGVSTGGHARTIVDDDARARLLDLAVKPLVERHGRHPAILGWEIINEPEWVTSLAFASAWLPPPLLRFASRVAAVVVRSPAPVAAMRRFIGDTSALIRQFSAHLITTGSVSPRSLPLVAGLGLDWYQLHWYEQVSNTFPLDVPVASYALDRPVILGEFQTSGSSLPPPAVLQAAQKAGFLAAFGWSVAADDRFSDRSACIGACRA